MLSIKSAIATLIVPGTACFLIPYCIITWGHLPLNPPFGILQIGTVVIGGLGFWMVVWVSTALVRRGLGTPIPIFPPTRLVTTGLYQYMRNPMYVGAVLTVLAEAVYFGVPWLVPYAIGLWAALHTALILFEEPQLKKRFGAEYEDYMQAVPRWIPKLRSR